MPEERTERDTVRPSTVRSFVRAFHDEIIAAWRHAVRTLPGARDLSAATLLDHVPELLDEIADIADKIAAGAHDPLDLRTARRHALDRLGDGFDIATIVGELSLLRDAAFGVWPLDHDRRSMADLRALNLAIDRVIAASTSRYAEQRFQQIADEREQVLAKLESLLAGSPIAIGFVDRDLRYLRVNEALAAFNEQPAQDHLGRTVAEVLPDVASTLEPLLRSVLDTGQPVLNLEITRASQTDPADTRFLLANYFPVRASSGEVTGVGGIVIDVTEVKRTQEALRDEQVRIRAILEHAPAAIWLKASDGCFVLANHRLAEALGHELEQMLGRRSSDLLPPEFAAAHEAHDQTVLREQRALEVEETVPSPRGTRTFLSIKFPIPGDPPLVGAIATDITQRKQMEHDLRSAVRTRDDVLAIVSHDLRGPLGAVQLSATLLMGQLPNDPHARRHLELIHRSCTRMEHLIDDLLDSANIRTGRLQLDVQPAPADAVLAEAIDLHQPVVEERGIRLIRTDDLDDLAIACDRDRVLQVFSNLIGNAIKFCRPGDTITVSGHRTGDRVVFAVADTGPGILPQVSDHLFEPYWSGPGHLKQGAGLGLYISRGIIEQHGGTIWVESTPGAGATFWFTLFAVAR
jgi:PAS domain S-box-containing protein